MKKKRFRQCKKFIPYFKEHKREEEKLTKNVKDDKQNN